MPEGRKDDFRLQMHMVMGLGAASIHTTSQLIANVIFDLAARPEYIQLLREEVTGVLAESGGKWSQDTVNNFKKMDSFVKESQRLTALPGEFWLLMIMIFLDRGYLICYV